jgi:hypothetical protein
MSEIDPVAYGRVDCQGRKPRKENRQDGAIH